MHFFLLIAFLIAVAFITIAFQNPEPVTMKFISWTLSEPLALALAVPFAAGLLSGIFLFIPMWWKKSRLVRSQKKRIKELETELSDVEGRVKETKQDEEKRLTEEETPDKDDLVQDETRGPGDIF